MGPRRELHVLELVEVSVRRAQVRVRAARVVGAAIRAGRVRSRVRVEAAAFGVFLRREVLNLHVFLIGLFFLCHGSYLLLWVVGCWGVGGTEKQLPSTADVLLWDQIVEADEFIFRLLLLLMFRISSLRTFFRF